MGQTAEELRAHIGEQRTDISRDLTAIGDHISPSRIVQRRRAAARRRVTELKDRVMGVADSSVEDVRHLGVSAAHTVADSASTAMHQTRVAAEGNPLAMGLVAFGAGLVAATVFPASRTERQIAQQAQPVLQKAVGEAGPAARRAVDELKPAAQQAIAEVGDAAKAAATTVKEEASAAAVETKREASQAQQDRTTP